MRVAVFTDNDFDKVNGVTTTLTALLEHAPLDLWPRIYTAAALATDAPDYLALRSLPVPVPFYREMKLHLPHWRPYLQRVLADGIDVLHLTTPGPMGLVARWVAGRTGLPLIGSFHTDLAAYATVLSGSPQLGTCMRHYLRWMYGRCREVLVPSKATRDLLTASGLPAANLPIWARGVDANLFSPGRRSAQLRERWRVSERQPAILYAGRVSREKGLELLPGMLRWLRAFGQPHRLIVAGDGPLRPWLAEHCPDAVFTGVLGREAMADVFASADVLVFPSRTDTAGNVVLEAQASGVPVIVSDTGGPRESMLEGLTGVVCAGADPPRWAAAVADLLHDTGLRQVMAAAARRYALARRWDVELDVVYRTYRAAAARGSGAAIHHAA